MKENFNFVFNLDEPIKRGVTSSYGINNDNTNGVQIGGILRIGNKYIKILSDIFINLGSPGYDLNLDDEIIDKVSGTIEHEHIHREIFKVRDVNRMVNRDDLIKEERILDILLKDKRYNND